MNFLPQNMQREISRERIIRLFAACGFSFFILSCVAITLLAPAYLTVMSERDVLADRLAELKTAPPKKNDSAVSLSEHATILRVFLPKSGVSGYGPLELLRQALEVRPAGVSVDNWSFAHNESEGTFQMTGMGQNPGALLAYQKAVRALPFVKDANFSRSFLTLKSNIPYSLTLTLK